MAVDNKIALYITHPHPCSYLPGKEAVTLFVDPDLSITRDLYSHSTDVGFRRSGRHLYKPRCSECSACISIRVCAQHFKLSRSHKRILKKNSDLEFRQIDNINNEQCYALYERYIAMRHFDGDMYPANQEQYDSFLQKIPDITEYFAVYLQEKILAVAVTDRLKNGLSAIYTFYDPSYTERSLGVFSILKQIELARHQKLPYLYLGFWIKDCQKMNYKTRYRPFQMFTNGRWIDVN